MRYCNNGGCMGAQPGYAPTGMNRTRRIIDSEYPIAMAYVPWQRWGETYDAEKALCALDGAPYVTFVASLFASCGELKNPVVYLQENRVSQKAALQTRLGTDRLEFVPYVDGGVLIREDDIDYDCRVSTVLNRFRNEHEPELQEILFGDNR